MREKEPSIVDLHPTEWQREGKVEPFFGKDALLFFGMTTTAIVTMWLVTTIMEYLVLWLGWTGGLLATMALTPVYALIAGRIAVLSIYLFHSSPRFLRWVLLWFRSR